MNDPDLKQQVIDLQNQLDENVERFQTFLKLTRQAYACIEFDKPISTRLPVGQQASCMLAARLVECNDTFAHIYQASSAADLEGARFVSLILSQEKFIERARRFVKSGYRLVDEEIENERPGGVKQILIGNYIGEVTTQGLTRLWAILQDVSLQRLIEHAASDGDSGLSQLSHQLDYGFWVMDWENFSMLYVGDAFETVWQVPKQKLMDEPMAWLDSVHPDDRQRVHGAFLSQIARGDYDETYRIILPDESIRIIRDRAFPLPNRLGEIERIVGLADDVTEPEEVRSGMNAFFDLSQEMLVVADADGIFQHVNPVFCANTGYTESALIGKDVIDFIHEDDRDLTVATVDKLSDGVAAVDVTNRFRFADQSWQTIQWNIAPRTTTGILYATIRQVAEDSRGQITEDDVALLETLTPRERQIMHLIVDGQPNKTIAKHLGISQRTVEKHRERVMKKLEVRNIPDLVRLAMKFESVN
ncbi:MAG: PAS domain-containing protein [Pirellulaceae bacterium]